MTASTVSVDSPACADLYNLTTSSVLGVFQAHELFNDLATAWLE